MSCKFFSFPLLLVLSLCLATTSTQDVMEFELTLTTKATCDNEERPENKAACAGQPYGAQVPYPGNCSKFLVCMCEYPTVKDCPGGTWWDNSLKTCNYPQNVNCPWSGGSSTTPSSTTSTPSPDNEWGVNCETPPGMTSDLCLDYGNGYLLRYPYNCNAYLNCTMGCPVMTYCPVDKVFNQWLKICDTPETAQCVELPMPSTTTPIPTTTTRTTELTTTTDITSTTTEICVYPSDIPENYCDGFEKGSVLSYPYNCSAYISCRNDCPHLEYCEKNKVFNSLLGICDDANTAECTEEPYPTPGTPGQTTEEPTPTTTTSTTTLPQFTPTLPPGIPEGMCHDHADYTLVPYAENCRQYLMCMQGEVELMNCPNGWLFNAQLKMCDDAGEQVCYTGPATTTTEASSSSTTTTTTSAPILDLCLDQPSGTSFPYPQDCKQYYYCRGNGTYYVLPCPNNNYYDPISGNCGPDVSPTACQETTTTTTTTTPAPTTLSPEQMCAGQEFGTTFPYEANCQEYIMCTNNGGYKIMKCPGNNYYYPDTGNCGPSNDVDICRKGETTTTTSKPSTTSTTTSTTNSRPTTTTTAAPTPGPAEENICGNYTNGELIEYPDNCHKYISCVRPIPIGFYCPGNLYFNLEQQKCSAEGDGECSQGSSNETTTAAPPSDICQNAEEGTHQVYPLDCQMYYECLGNGNYMLQVCNQGEYYNPLTQQCSSQVGPNYCKGNFDTTTTTTTTTASPPKPQHGICWEKPNGYKIPYPNDCSKFIVCNQPIPTGYYCPAGLEFSSEAQTCVEPWQSDCGGLTTTTTTESQQSTTPTDNKCSHEPDYTILPYESDCSQFIICIDNEENIAVCPKGQYFDVVKGMCSSQANSQSCRYDSSSTTTTEMTTSTTTTNEVPTTSTTIEMSTTTTTTSTTPSNNKCSHEPDYTLLPYEPNCSLYIMCINNIETLGGCPKGQYFDVLKGMCSSQGNPQSCLPSTTSTTTTKMPTSTTTEMPTTSTTTSTTPSNNKCSHEPDYTLLPYEPNCSLYIMCINNIETLGGCPKGQYFDVLKGMCSSEGNPQSCLPSSTSTTTTKMSTSTTTEMPTTSTTTSTTPSNNKCSHEPDDTLLPYEPNCALYIVCYNNTEYLGGCPKGQYFDVLKGMCSSEGNPQSCLPISTSTTTTEMPTTSSTSTAPPNNRCSHEPNDTLLPYEPNCALYIVCYNNTEYLGGCPKGQYFDVLKGMCSSEGNSQSCLYGSTTEMPTSTTTTTTPKPNMGPCYGVANGGKVPYPNNCRKYIECHDPIPVAMECPEGLEFNSDLGECVRPEDANCSIKTTTTETPTTTTSSSITNTSTTNTPTTTEYTTSSPANICADLPTGSTITYPADCSKYYMCLNGNAVLVSCMPNTYYNPASGECDTSSPTQCREGLPTPPTTELLPTTTTTELPTTSSTTTTPANICADLPTGSTITYPADCSKYYMCLNGNPVLVSCMPNTYYNPASGQCDTSSPTQCREDQQSTSTTESPTTTDLHTTSSSTTSELPTTTTSTSTTTTESNPSENNGNICCGHKTGTLLPYPGNNTKYVICLYPVPEVAECLANSIYDPISETCKTEDNGFIPMPECTSVPYGQGLPYEGDCRKYYQCFGTMAKVMNCADNWYFNAQLGDPNEQQSGESDSNGIEGEIDSNVPEDNEDNSTPIKPAAIPNYKELAELCENTQKDIIPYPQDSQHFVVCLVDPPYYGDCGDGMCFESALAMCIVCPPTPTAIPNYKELAELCENNQNSIIPYPQDSQHYVVCFVDPPYYGDWCPPTPTAIPNYKELAELCENNQNSIIPYPQDSQHYVVCFVDPPYYGDCGDGMCFDGAFAMCLGCPPTPTAIPNYKELAELCENNQNSIIPYPQDSQHYVVCFVDPPYYGDCGDGMCFDGAFAMCLGCPPTPTAIPNYKELAELCENNQNSIIPYPQDSQHYVVCFVDPPYYGDCGDGMCFDGAFAKCRVCPPTPTAIPNYKELAELCENNQNSIIPYPQDSQHYVVCFVDPPYYGDCGDGMCFDGAFAKCRVCPPTPRICNGKPTLEKVPLDCQTYYICMAQPLAIECPANQHYSSDKGKCLPAIEANCLPFGKWCQNKQNGLRFESQNCHQYYECQDEEIFLKSCQFNEYYDKAKGNCVPGFCTTDDGTVLEREPICTTTMEGVKMVHPKCYKYYVCLNKIAYESQCPTGYYFNATSKKCIIDTNETCKDS
ncbi:mucin-2-like [Musca vetustissima]|uniref:mucin-2-like n=1 Tax=Musca vetustissima TaxID=27455 RepID=UPI002AB674D9|nr:mucin-2-like [Musca vetustissima]